jgi:hypothetical protein
MKTKQIIEGLQILQKYRDDQDGYYVDVEHDVIYAYATDKPLEASDVERMIQMGWFQKNAERDEAFSVKHYDATESWTAFV